MKNERNPVGVTERDQAWPRSWPQDYKEEFQLLTGASIWTQEDRVKI